MLWESAFRRVKFCEILSHSVRYGMYGRQNKSCFNETKGSVVL